MKSSTDLKCKDWDFLKGRTLPLYDGMTVKVKLEKETVDVVKLYTVPVSDRTCTLQSQQANSLQKPVGTFDKDEVPDAITFTEKVDPVLAACFVFTLRKSDYFLSHCLKTFSFICQQRKKINCGIPANCSHLLVLISIMPQSYHTMEADIRWSDRILSLWTNRIIIEDVFSWFSTLGGAYSSLGDYHNSCAIQAGFLSVKQLKLAWTLGDPFLQSRCLIYLSQSLMQRGFFKLARKIIRKQYHFAITSKPYDQRLVSMCEGVWTRLQYSQWKRKVDKGMDTDFKMVTLSQSYTSKAEGHSNGHIKVVEVTH